jgi:hypothetical protein
VRRKQRRPRSRPGKKNLGQMCVDDSWRSDTNLPYAAQSHQDVLQTFDPKQGKHELAGFDLPILHDIQYLIDVLSPENKS